MKKKRCKICQKDLPLKAFHRKVGCVDGRLPRCKTCRSSLETEDRAASNEKKSVQKLVAFGLEIEDAKAIFIKRRQDRKSFKQRTPEEKKEASKKWRTAWYAVNKQRLNEPRAEYFRRYRKAHSEYYSLACHKRRARLKGLGTSFTFDEWQDLLTACDHRCLACGKRTTDDDFPPTNSGNKRLTKDHVIPICKGGSNDISNIQPLCWKCHQQKGRTTADYRVKLA